MSPQHEGKTGKPRLEVADVFRLHGEAYRLSRRLPSSHLKIMRAVEACRTAKLGGHLDRCDSCGFTRQAYNSCRNRHCPKCQALTKARWLDARKAELLPVPYFHNVFTLPHELNALALCNKKAVFEILFQAVSQTLLTFSEKEFGGSLGVTAILHTWDQTLRDHIHLHCAIPAGALSSDGQRWVHARKDFLFPVKALAVVFRGKFMAALKEAYARQELIFPGRTADLADPETFKRLIRELYQKNWIVYSKAAFNGPQAVLDYIGRYTHRIAISNNRILAVKDGAVTFSYRDRRDENRRKAMTLAADEFIRRFLLHALPTSFMKIRHFGFLANRRKKEALARCRELLVCPVETPASETETKTTRELLQELTGFDLARCPECHTGKMQVVGEIPMAPWRPAAGWDSS